MQTVPHAPQFAASEAVVTQRPLQLVWPAGQRSTQVPLEQVCVAVHARPQAPQLATLVERFTSQPVVATPSQSAKPVAQVRPQRDAAQVRVALAPVGHEVPQAPQFAGSVAVSTQLDAHRT